MLWILTINRLKDNTYRTLLVINIREGCPHSDSKSFFQIDNFKYKGLNVPRGSYYINLSYSIFQRDGICFFNVENDRHHMFSIQKSLSYKTFKSHKMIHCASCFPEATLGFGDECRWTPETKQHGHQMIETWSLP